MADPDVQQPDDADSFPDVARGKKHAFLQAYVEVGTITAAAQCAGISRRTHTNWLNGDEKYAAAFRDAVEMAADSLEKEAIRRATEGNKEPVGWYQGEPGGYVQRYSDVLLIFLLKAKRPHQYRDNWTAPSDSELDQIRRDLADPPALATAPSDAAVEGGPEHGPVPAAEGGPPQREDDAGKAEDSP